MMKLEVIGNLGADAVVKDSNGSKFVTFRVAHTEKWTSQDGKENVTTDWVDVTMNNTESKIIPYLKEGTRVFVRGMLKLRVYSSKKDRCMKAGAQVSALEVELLGGNNDLVPRQLIDPDTAQLYNTTKYYWCNADTKGLKIDDVKMLVDQKGRQYIMNKQGFVAPIPDESQGDGNSPVDDSKQENQ